MLYQSTKAFERIMTMSYDKTAAFEEFMLERAFIPYSVGTMSDKLTSNDQYRRANILFFTDSHIDLINPDECLENVKRTIDYVNNSKVPFDAVLHAGDIITPFNVTQKRDAYERAEKFFEIAKECRVPFIFSKGNHDINDWKNYPCNVLTDADFGSLFLDYAEKKYGIKRQTKSDGVKSSWHYRDIEEHKIRIISADTLDVDKLTTDADGKVLYYSASAWGVSDEQLNWIAHTALDFDDKAEKDWGVIIVTHMAPSYGCKTEPAYENSISKLFELTAAFNNAGKYDHEYRFPANGSFDISLHADYTKYASLSKRPHIITWLLGHEHCDKYEKVHGINLITTANASCTDNCSDARVARIPGTFSQNCFDIINIDCRKRRIRAFRYGAGQNCYGSGGHRFLPDGIEY